MESPPRRSGDGEIRIVQAEGALAGFVPEAARLVEHLGCGGEDSMVKPTGIQGWWWFFAFSSAPTHFPKVGEGVIARGNTASASTTSSMDRLTPITMPRWPATKIRSAGVIRGVGVLLMAG